MRVFKSTSHTLNSSFKLYLSLSFLLLSLNFGVELPKQSETNQQGLAAPNAWILEPSKLRRLSPNQQNSSFFDFAPALSQLSSFVLIFSLLCFCLYHLVSQSKRYLIEGRLLLEGG